MTFNYTDKQLNRLNRGRNVYSVNTNYVDRQRQENKTYQYIVAKPDNELKSNEQNKITTPDAQQFQVIKTHSDPETGFDGMAVAPIINGEVDFGSVAVIAAATDTQSVDLKTALVSDPDEKRTQGYYLSPQYQSAETFVKEVMVDKRVTAVTQLSGYSQSSYMIKVGAKYGIPTTTFNAWFQYGSLSKDEKEFIRNHPGLFIDYRNNKDQVVWINDSNDPYKKGYDDSLRSIYWAEGTSHKIEDWTSYDSKTGRLLNPKTGLPFVSGAISAYVSSISGMSSFYSLKSSWSSGGINSDEELYLDVAQSYVIGKSMADTSKAGLDEMTVLKHKADREVEEIWSKIDFSLYSELSPWEVKEIFASHGVTYQQIVSDFQDYTAQKVRKMETLSTTFDHLKTTLDEAIEEKVALDNQLSGAFKTWRDSL